MSIFCIGVNHKTAPVEIRERLAIAESRIPENLTEICELDSVSEVVVLSTCNRVEVYGASENPAAALDGLADFLIGHFDVEKDQVEFYRHDTEEAAHHLFEVASGLDSMMLGETEIFGQVKKAYSTAQETGTTSRRMNKLFQQSFRIGKLVRSSTKIQQGATSVGAAAVDLAEKIFGRLKESHVMLVGAGEMSRVTAQSLLSRGAEGIIVSNRHFDRAEELADELGGRAVKFDQWEDELHEVDIIISSTAAPHAVIHAPMIEEAMRKRRGHPLFLIDIAVPRDVEDEVNEVPNAYLYNIDELQELASKGRARRQKQIAICRDVIDEYLREKGIEALREIPAKHQQNEDRGDEGAGEPVTNM